ncbi:death-associated protein kinase 1 isoform X1 [Prionailurus iriomotensis]
MAYILRTLRPAAETHIEPPILSHSEAAGPLGVWEDHSGRISQVWAAENLLQKMLAQTLLYQLYKVPALTPIIQAGSLSVSNLYPGWEHVTIRSCSMMFGPGLTRGTLEVVVAPPQHPHCVAGDQSTKAIDIQNAYLNGF